MEYLYYLQNLRDVAPEWLNEGILFVSEFVGGVGGMSLLALIYWCLSKQAGTLLLMNVSFSQVINGVIKNIFCVERPFNRDSRLTPYVPVKGYSFPSGHTMLATGFYGGIALWQKKRKWLVAVCVVMMFFTGFTRNWLGAHTIEDVIVGIACSCALIAANALLLNWVDKHPEKDIWVFLGAAFVCLVYCLAFPTMMRSAGMYGGVMLGWILERRFIKFEIQESKLFRAVMFVLGIAVVGVLYKVLLPFVFGGLNSNWSGMLTYFIIFLTITAGWPTVIKLSAKK